MFHFFQKITFPVKKVREEMKTPSQKAMVLMDNFSGQTTTSLLEKVEEKRVVVITIPPGTTDRLQPLEREEREVPIVVSPGGGRKAPGWYSSRSNPSQHGDGSNERGRDKMADNTLHANF